LHRRSIIERNNLESWSMDKWTDLTLQVVGCRWLLAVS
jgi:hypothetical protein